VFEFTDIVGQEELKQKLVREAMDGHIPHAQLFCGAEGTGAMPLALAYARLLCCPNRSAGKACCTCRSCKQWESLVHPDVHFMFPIVSNEKRKKSLCSDYLKEWREMLCQNPYFSYTGWLDAMDAENGQPIIYAKESDEITRRLSLKSVEGECKVVIIWLPEKMHESCANKMLKLLEEPPEKTYFLMASVEPEKLLPTILSRTQRIVLQPLREGEIARALQVKYGVSEEQSLSIAHLAGGSMTKALDTIHVSQENEWMLDLFTSLMRLAYARRIREMKAWSEQVAGLGRERQKQLLIYCQHMIRESFIANFHQPQMSYMTPEETAFTNRFAPFVNENNAVQMCEELSEAQVHIEQNVNAKMVFFDLALKMIMLLKH